MFSVTAVLKIALSLIPELHEDRIDTVSAVQKKKKEVVKKKVCVSA